MVLYEDSIPSSLLNENVVEDSVLVPSCSMSCASSFVTRIAPLPSVLCGKISSWLSLLLAEAAIARPDVPKSCEHPVPCRFALELDMYSWRWTKGIEPSFGLEWSLYWPREAQLLASPKAWLSQGILEMTCRKLGMHEQTNRAATSTSDQIMACAMRSREVG